MNFQCNNIPIFQFKFKMHFSVITGNIFFLWKSHHYCVVRPKMLVIVSNITVTAQNIEQWLLNDY